MTAFETNFPEKIRSLPRFSERFEAFRLAAENCEIFFAQYPAETKEEFTTEIEFWFKVNSTPETA